MTKRHAPPQHYDDWLAIAAKVPRLCHSCDNYNASGVCIKFEMTPPEEFAGTLDACEDWQVECGF